MVSSYKPLLHLRDNIKNMKAIRIEKFGCSDVLKYGYEAEPSVGEDEVLIKIKGAGVGRVDISARKGLYGPLSEPGFIPGIEVAGEVITLGKNAANQWLGKRVFARLFQGGYAEEIAVPVSALVEIPDELTEIQAIAFGVNALVASYSLGLASLQKGNRLLIRGATGGIGSVAAILAKANGIMVTASVQSDSKIINLEKIGIQDFLKHKDLDSKATPYNAILDLVLGSGLDPYINLLAERGHYVIAGGAAGSPDVDFGMSFLTRVHKSLNLHVFSLNTFSDSEVNIRMTQLFKLITQHSLSSPVHEVFSLQDAVKAHDLLESGNVFGKIILAN